MMRVRILLAVSLGLNLGLLGVLAYLHRVEPGAKTFVVRPRIVTNTVRRVVTETVTVPARVKPARLVFHWSRVESPDYRKYMANLREIGCPEPTIRDVILADVNDEFARRKAAVLDPVKARFWQLMMQRGQPVDRDTEGQLAELAEQRRALLDDLLGPDWEKTEAKAADSFDYHRFQLSYLSEEKRQQVLALRERFQDERRFPGGKEYFAELEEILTPEELEEYKLRTARSANVLRDLRGIDLTEKQFRDIVRLHVAFEEANPQGARNDPDSRFEPARREQAQKLLEEQIQTLLGEAKFSEYQRARDSAYQTAYNVGRRYDLPPETAARIYDMKQAAETQAQRVNATRNLSADQRQAALTAIRLETEKTMADLFGENAYQTYKKYGGEWLKDLAPEP